MGVMCHMPVGDLNSKVPSNSMLWLLRRVTLEEVAFSSESQSHNRLGRWKLVGAFMKESSL